MKSLNGRSGTFRRYHGDRAEAARAIGASNREIDLNDIAIGGKQIHKIVGRSGGRQVAQV
jgi:hypothetical protein